MTENNNIQATGNNGIAPAPFRADFAPFEPRDYQDEIYQRTIEHIKTSAEPAFIYASVSAGKSACMAMIAKHAQDKALHDGKQQVAILALARTGELVEQNAAEFWDMHAKNSIFSASVGIKSTRYPVIVGSERTVFLALEHSLKNFTPTILLIDECLTGDSIISTEDGMLRIDDPRLKNVKIHCMDESTGEIKCEKPLRVFSNGVKCISRVKHAKGEIYCTATHKIYAQGSWVEAKNLKRGQRITIDGSSDFVLNKLLRAVAAVVKKPCLDIARQIKSRQAQIKHSHRL